MPNIIINLWFRGQAEEAAQFYTSIFPNSSIDRTIYYPEVGQEITDREPGSVFSVEFTLDGQPFAALNGDDQPSFKFNESVSFIIPCETQEEIDRYWDELTKGGGEPGSCGWLKDKYGVSWQVTPTLLNRLLADPDKAKADRANAARLKMKKLSIAELQAAAHAV